MGIPVRPPPPGWEMPPRGSVAWLNAMRMANAPGSTGAGWKAAAVIVVAVGIAIRFWGVQ